MISFYFELSGTFSIATNNFLQYYVNAFNKKYLLDKCNGIESKKF